MRILKNIMYHLIIKVIFERRTVECKFRLKKYQQDRLNFYQLICDCLDMFNFVPYEGLIQHKVKMVKCD